MSVREGIAVVYSMRQGRGSAADYKNGVCIINKPLPVSSFLPQGFCIDMVEIT
ncbi:hypothetical protein [Anaplasma phagocytophilum]|uniref:Uncharacterized protein n=1 Tax=Anaplasma phagocytophilum str. CRT53-1 TaxID=1359157 RepID=A0A0F3Q263_ANAPH|nr:hypothetical protein [Anaplasma phagocytophilum]KJV86251.1 hypothetical protein APHCRT_0563 [Anaplasma phagocytophilum str. CRT53-1]